MRISTAKKIAMLVGSSLLIVVGFVNLIGSVQLQSITISAPGEGFFTLRRLQLVLNGVICVAFGVFVFSLPIRAHKYRKSFITQQTAGGELRIAVGAIENLVNQCVDVHEDIKLNSMDVRSAREGVVIDLCVSLTGNMAIPQLVSGLQKQIKQYLLASSGIDVAAVKVSVEKAESQVKVSSIPGDGSESTVEEKKEEAIGETEHSEVSPVEEQAREIQKEPNELAH